MFMPGQRYKRSELHDQYKGNRQGGISTPSNEPFIMLFTGNTAPLYGYIDDWIDEGHYQYTGEGQLGDMKFIRGNRAIRDHIQNGKDLYLFEKVGKGFVRCINQMKYTGHRIEQGPDRSGNIRDLIIFDLIPLCDLE